jgi:hypothetical protein
MQAKVNSHATLSCDFGWKLAPACQRPEASHPMTPSWPAVLAECVVKVTTHAKYLGSDGMVRIPKRPQNHHFDEHSLTQSISRVRSYSISFNACNGRSHESAQTSKSLTATDSGLSSKQPPRSSSALSPYKNTCQLPSSCSTSRAQADHQNCQHGLPRELVSTVKSTSWHSLGKEEMVI